MNNRYELNKNLAQMLKGGVIMDVTTPEQAKIAEQAGAAAVMALERIPADIRAAGGVSRMSDPKMIRGIQNAVSIPVMAKVRIGHFVEAQILQALEIDYIDESEVLSPADGVYHIDKTKFRVPFVCGAKNLGEALRRIAEGASMIRTKGEPGTGDVIQAVTHMRSMMRDIRRLQALPEDELYNEAKELEVPYDLVKYVHENGKLPVVNFAAGGVATPADAALMMQLGAEGVFVGSGIFKSGLRRLRYLQVRQSGEEGPRHRQRSDQLQRRRPAGGGIHRLRRGHGGHQRGGDHNPYGRERQMRIGILALQGAFLEHGQMLEGLHAEHFEIRQRSDLDSPMDGLILPGGESTAMGKLMDCLDMLQPLRERISGGLPVFGTCAGMILLAKDLGDEPRRFLQTMDIRVLRNAYGRQLGSFFTRGAFAGMKDVPMTFIRAPYIEQVTAPDVEILATVDGHIVAARQRNMLATSFHPELNDDPRIHRWFLEHIV